MAKMGRPRKTKLNRRIIQLKDACGLKFAEIGRVFGITRASVRNSYLRQKDRDANKKPPNVSKN